MKQMFNKYLLQMLKLFLQILGVYLLLKIFN